MADYYNATDPISRLSFFGSESGSRPCLWCEPGPGKIKIQIQSSFPDLDSSKFKQLKNVDV